MKGVTYTPRTIVLTGSPSVVLSPKLKRLQTRLNTQDFDALRALPLEALGTEVLRRYLRKEELT